LRSLVLSVNYRIIISLLCMIILSSFLNESGLGIVTVSAEASNKPNTTSDLSIYDQRRNLYEEIEILTQIPWYWIAALDQYERSITPRKEIKKENSRLAGIRFKETMWAGPFNPNLDDKNPATIAMFGGIGQDATADGSADPENDRDSWYRI
jgi:hypothetical protein